MSQPIYCSAPECGAEADVIIGDTHSGDQTPLCFPDLYAWCGMFRAQVDDAEIEQTDSDAVARIAGVTAPPQSRYPTDDDGYTLQPEDVGEAPAFPATAKVVRKHTSKSRRAYEDRKAAKVTAAAATATVEEDNALRRPESVTEGAEADD